MPAFGLTVLKVVFLLLLYLFVYRAVRAVAVDIRASRAVPPAAGTPPMSVRQPTAAQRAPSRQTRPGKPPRSLVVVDEKGAKVASLQLDGAMQIGRGDSCRIRLQDTYASALHARVFDREDGWFVEDLGSTNGSYLNQRRLTAPARIHAGDRLRIGKTTLEFRR